MGIGKRGKKLCFKLLGYHRGFNREMDRVNYKV